MIQYIILGVVFIAALAFLARTIYRNVKNETDCTGDGCPKCSPQKTWQEKA